MPVCQRQFAPHASRRWHVNQVCPLKHFSSLSANNARLIIALIVLLPARWAEWAVCLPPLTLWHCWDRAAASLHAPVELSLSPTFCCFGTEKKKNPFAGERRSSLFVQEWQPPLAMRALAKGGRPLTVCWIRWVKTRETLTSLVFTLPDTCTRCTSLKFTRIQIEGFVFKPLRKNKLKQTMRC